MDPILLRCFAAIARQGHLKRAADELHLTKQTICYHLKELEAAVRQPLFSRSPSGMRLTEAGRHLLPIAQKTLDAYDEFTASAEDLGRGLSGRVDLGVISDAVWLRAPQVMVLLNRHHPDLAVRLHHAQSGLVPRDILEGRLTAGWVMGSIDQPGLAVRTLANFRMRVVGPRSWARQLDGSVLSDLADFPWVDAPEHCAFTFHRRFLFAESGRQPVGRFQVNSERALYGIVTEGQVLSLLREDHALAGQQAGELALWPGTVPALRLSFVLPTIRQDEPIGRALFDAVSQVWGLSRAGAPQRDPRAMKLGAPSQHSNA